MTAISPAVAGDIGDTRDITLAGVANLSTVTTVEAHVWRTGSAPVTLAATVKDAAARVVTVQLGAAGGWLPLLGPTLTSERQYFFEIEATFADATVLTWPSGKPDTLTIRPQGD